MDPSANYHMVVDIGNTHTVIGLFSDQNILHRWRVATRRDTTVDEIAFWLRGLAETPISSSLRTPSKGVSALALASVVPTQDQHWLAALQEVFQIQPQVLDYRNCLHLKLDYEIPRQIGADRLANVLGAKALGIESGVILDFGTATTFDVFSGNAYHGGIICPGIQSSMSTLAKSAAKLSEAELKWTPQAVGRNTEDAMRIGILSGTAGMVDYLVHNILRDPLFKGKKPVVVATGGLSTWMKDHAKSISRYEADITLIGINFLLCQGKKHHKVKGQNT